MALITCDECKNQVSDNTATCLHCGASVNEQEAVPEVPTVQVPTKQKASNHAGMVTAMAVMLFMVDAFTDSLGDDYALRPGYFMCKELPLQLRWFTAIDSSIGFMDAGAATNARLSDTSYEAQKALVSGWCADTEGMEYFTVTRIESCGDEWDQIPNGGCVKVTVSPQASSFQSTWYTFKDAISR